MLVHLPLIIGGVLYVVAIAALVWGAVNNIGP